MQKQMQVHHHRRSQEYTAEVDASGIERQLLLERAARLKLTEEVELCIEAIDEELDSPTDG